MKNDLKNIMTNNELIREKVKVVFNNGLKHYLNNDGQMSTLVEKIKELDLTGTDTVNYNLEIENIIKVVSDTRGFTVSETIDYMYTVIETYYNEIKNTYSLFYEVTNND